MTPRLISLCSPVMGSGKSTIADHLVARHGFVRVAFAAPLKRMVRTLLLNCGYTGQWPERHVSGDLKEHPLGDIGPFTHRHATAMLDALGPLPAEVTMSRDELVESLVEWGGREFCPGVTSRRLQQTIGTEWGRDTVHRELWALIARDRWRSLSRPVVVDDMRFPNELEAVDADGGEAYRVCRPDVSLVGGSHASEGQLDAVAMPEIWNTGSVDDLLTAADRAFRLTSESLTG